MIHIPIPSELRDKDLIGSRWIRRMGKHRGVVGTLVSFNDAGCKLKIQGRNQNQSHMGDVRFGSIQWPMLMNLYEPEGKLSLLVTVDKQGFVQSVKREDQAEVVAPVIEGKAPEPEMPEVETKICKGPWHRGKGGQGTPVPVSEFGIVKIGPYTGKMAKTCNSCLQKNHQYDAARGRTKKVTPSYPAPVSNGVVPVPEPLVIDPVVHVPGGRQWAVTIVKEVTIIVEADDFLDAGTKAGDGEIVKVERIK